MNSESLAQIDSQVESSHAESHIAVSESHEAVNQVVNMEMSQVTEEEASHEVSQSVTVCAQEVSQSVQEVSHTSESSVSQSVTSDSVVEVEASAYTSAEIAEVTKLMEEAVKEKPDSLDLRQAKYYLTSKIVKKHGENIFR